MPQWGLTEVQIDAEPWGLRAHWLRPAKQITDALGRDVYLTKLETAVVDSPPMQRLRHVRQLGSTHKVYPNAVHNRFSHSLGALRAAQDILDALFAERAHQGPKPDLFSEWRRQGRVADETISVFDRHAAEVTVLARLGALMHDMCHVPFGHTIEDDLGILDSHDHNEERFDRLWSDLDDAVREAIEGADDLASELGT